MQVHIIYEFFVNVNKYFILSKKAAKKAAFMQKLNGYAVNDV